MTPLKENLAVLEFNVFFDITNISERWKIYWPTLRKNDGVWIQPDCIQSRKNK